MRYILPLLLALPLAAQESKVEIDNAWVEVLRVKLGPHAATQQLLEMRHDARFHQRIEN